ncbi:MAG: hypothetical protein PWP51_1070 [Clostridiales bacterium]|nr:hypothetical protein [Clostridiales bacterium]MDN5298517.1 hypothetical protein [Clostridiales bacterium]
MIIGLILLLVFLFLGMPIGFCLGAAGIIGLTYVQGFDLAVNILMTTPFRSVASYTLVTIPLFVLMAEFLDVTGLAKKSYVAAYKWIGHLRGGLGIATIIGGAAFGACSGSSSASTATFGAIAIPEMKKCNYSDELSAGTVAIAGTLAAIIPPSILLVVYGSQANVSIGKVLIAGIIPGIMMALLYALGVWLIVRIWPKNAPPVEPYSWSERFKALLDIWPMVIIALMILIFLYSGITTPTETAAFGAIVTLLLGILTKSITLKDVIKSLKNTLKTTAMMFTIIIGAQIFTYYLTLTGLTQAAITAISGLEVSNGVIMLLIVIVYLFLGMFLPSMGTMLLTLPLVLPLMIEMGYDPIWFGVVLVMLLEVGLITPPVGLNCFIASGTSGIPLSKVFKGAMPLLAMAMLGILLMIVFPQIVLWLPTMMN